jgi:hypothetical protein
LDDGGVVEVDVHVMCGKVGEGGRAVVRSGSFFLTHAAEGRADSRDAEPRRKVDLRTNFFLHFILFRSRDIVNSARFDWVGSRRPPKSLSQCLLEQFPFRPGNRDQSGAFGDGDINNSRRAMEVVLSACAVCERE